MARVISGEQFRAARSRSGMDNQALADYLGVSTSTLSNWALHGVVERKENLVAARMAAWLSEDAEALENWDDLALVAEMNRIIWILGRRLACYRAANDGTGVKMSGQAFESSMLSVTGSREPRSGKRGARPNSTSPPE